jgi:hypothetical protein
MRHEKSKLTWIEKGNPCENFFVKAVFHRGGGGDIDGRVFRTTSLYF